MVKSSLIFLFHSIKSQGKAGRDFCLSGVSVSHAASRGCSLGGTVYTPSLAQRMCLKSPSSPLWWEQTKSFTYAWSYGLCNVIQHVINKSKFSKAQTVCFQSNPSGKHFYFHIALFWIFFFFPFCFGFSGPLIIYTTYSASFDTVNTNWPQLYSSSMLIPIIFNNIWIRLHMHCQKKRSTSDLNH